jgi:hypothetical protein
VVCIGDRTSPANVGFAHQKPDVAWRGFHIRYVPILLQKSAPRWLICYFVKSGRL